MLDLVLKIINLAFISIAILIEIEIRFAVYGEIFLLDCHEI